MTTTPTTKAPVTTTSTTTPIVITPTITPAVKTTPIATTVESGSNLSVSAAPAEITDDIRHRFLAYLLPQLEPLRQACERNWLIQAVLTTLAAFQIYNPTMVNGVASALKIPVESFNAVIPLVLTYLFIRFGYLLNAYLFIRAGVSQTIKSFSLRPPMFELEGAERMFSSNSLVELFCLEYQRDRFKRNSLILGILPLLVAAIFALNHRLVFLYLDRLVGNHPNLLLFIKLFIVGVLACCYYHFLGTTNRAGARLVAGLSIFFTLLLFLFMR